MGKGGRRRGEIKREKGQGGDLGCGCHCFQSPAFQGSVGGVCGVRRKRQLKPVGVGHVSHLHPSQGEAVSPGRTESRRILGSQIPGHGDMPS